MDYKVAWRVFKASVKQMLRKAVPSIVNFVRQTNGPTIAEFRMQTLERIAMEAKTSLTGNKLLGFSNQVERYYPRVIRREDLIDM